MPGNDRARSLGRSLKALQTSVERAGPAAAASYSLIGAILLLGGIGYGCDDGWEPSRGASSAG